MERETRRTILYLRRTASVGWGAGFGMIKSDVDKQVRHVAISTRHVPNPTRRATSRAMLESISNSNHLNLNSLEKWQSASWSLAPQRTRTLERFFLTGISFSDDHSSSVHHEFAPKEQSLNFQAEVIRLAKANAKTLTIPEQFDIALNITNGNPLDASIVAFSGSRSIGRNHDQRAHYDPKTFLYSTAEIDTWLKSVSHFTSSPKFDPLGDTYHWWTACTMGMIIRAWIKEQPVKAGLAYQLYNQGANLMVVIRKYLAGRPLNYVHREVDREGLNTGYEIANHYIK